MEEDQLSEIVERAGVIESVSMPLSEAGEVN